MTYEKTKIDAENITLQVAKIVKQLRSDGNKSSADLLDQLLEPGEASPLVILIHNVYLLGYCDGIKLALEKT